MALTSPSIAKEAADLAGSGGCSLRGVQDITENDGLGGVGKCPYEHRVYGAYGYGHDSMCWAEGDCRTLIRFAVSLFVSISGEY